MSSVYVVVALALVCLILVVIDRIRQQHPVQKEIGMLELKEFKDLPMELRAAIKKVLPDPDHVRKTWNNLTVGQKQMFMQQFTSLIPHPHPHPPHHPPPPPPPPQPPLKKGFLLKQNKKKDSKNEKKDEIVTLSVVRADDTDGPTLDGSDTAFLGSDD